MGANTDVYRKTLLLWFFDQAAGGGRVTVGQQSQHFGRKAGCGMEERKNKLELAGHFCFCLSLYVTLKSFRKQ